MKDFKHIISKYAGALVVAVALLASCDDIGNDTFKEPKYQTGIQYMEEDPDGSYDRWLEIVKASDYYGLLNARGDYTFFACDNESVEAFLAEKGGMGALEKDYVNRLVRNHVVMSRLTSFGMRQGPMPDTTMNGDYLTVNFREGGLNNMLINHQAKITERDVECSNGMFHTVDKVLEPLKEGLSSVISKDARFGIFAGAVEKTGLAEELDKLTAENGDLLRYTVLIETDDIYKKEGINNLDALVEKLGAGSDFTSPTNALNRFVRYHVLGVKLYSTRFRDYVFPTLGKEMVRMMVRDGSYLINPVFDDFGGLLTEKSNKVDLFNMDFQGSNGVFHILDKVMYEESPEPSAFIYDPCDVPELDYLRHKRRDFVHVDQIKSWRGQGHVSFEYRYMTSSALYERDNIVSYVENGWFEFDTPAIIKGKYRLNCSFWQEWNGGPGAKSTVRVYVDGKLSDRIVKQGEDNVDIGVFEFTENKTHVIRFESLVGGGQFAFDRISFTPVK
ncbi:hypothetical protein FUAX_43730 (plasmid) [Fulvitalea axinellae]|uniref:FAS1 domain-containing protein n=1 Tax=Fulvitalea axinellae TaxID=1182444 RepID=A0AAU9CS31_9BACT|nr:hypothetical protein FUAX_43730 [Fulvitalea axinellae]